MTCRDLHDCLGDLLDGSLAPARRREAHVHLLQCADCSRSRESYVATVALARAVYAPDVSSAQQDIPEDLVGQILAAARPHRSPAAVWGLVQLISGIAASQLIVFYLGH
jgi:anti-sigma factor RsiW